MALRSVAYREILNGHASVREAYRRIASQTPETEVSRQARMLEWFHESPTNMLLGIQINGRYRLYVDGSEQASADDPGAALRVVPVSLSPGKHTIALELTPTRPMASVLMNLRTHTTNMALSAESCLANFKKPVGWPSFDGSSPGWTGRLGYGHLPTQTAWALTSNAFPNMQAGAYIDGIYDWIEWRNSQTPAYFVREFVIPEKRTQL
jgi:hypothetical protein